MRLAVLGGLYAGPERVASKGWMILKNVHSLMLMVFRKLGDLPTLFADGVPGGGVTEGTVVPGLEAIGTMVGLERLTK